MRRGGARGPTHRDGPLMGDGTIVCQWPSTPGTPLLPKAMLRLPPVGVHAGSGR